MRENITVMSDLILEITKIGDLLLNHKISNLKNNSALENIKLTISEYQRPYKWTSKMFIFNSNLSAELRMGT